MATPKIGYSYRLDISSDYHSDPILWANAKAKYQVWADVGGKIVKVKARSTLDVSNYLVELLELPKHYFYTPKKFLMELTRRLPIPCSCDLLNLINRGCQCGAFKKEKKNKKIT